MDTVSPDSLTTLILNAAFIPINLATARAAFNHTITGRAKPIDRFGNPHGFPEDESGHIIDDVRQHYWFLNKDVLLGKQITKNTNESYKEDDGIYFENQPIMHSGHDVWPIPTIMVATTKYFIGKPSQSISISKLAKRYKNQCQICGKRFSIRELTIDHVYPRSKHGPNDVGNVLPVCQPCNLKKADIFPYFDSNGVRLEKKIKPTPRFLEVDEKTFRKEWETFIIFK